MTSAQKTILMLKYFASGNVRISLRTRGGKKITLFACATLFGRGAEVGEQRENGPLCANSRQIFQEREI